MLAEVEGELAAALALVEDLVAGATAERRHVGDRAGIGGDDLEHVAAGELGDRLLGLEHRQRAVEVAAVELLRRGDVGH